ncbi:hypothetical protein E5676_scaffold546G00740 [Cucumis melo var. makuwa]|uniref:Uncharacterized protein n=1 Tax=Cucumis melo var. makuwa TaxID=1194695 RepID=A0A5D3B998_CUCMM|nr:hypothetical protein E5676_scaffold546G00740 [Cucumis melo var. makuwa]
MTRDRSHCNEDSQFPLPLDQWAIWCCWWSTGSLSSWCCSFSLDHIGIVFLIEAINCLHECLPDLASTDSAGLESSFRYWIVSAGLKFNNELISSGSVSQHLVICYQDQANVICWTFQIFIGGFVAKPIILILIAYSIDPLLCFRVTQSWVNNEENEEEGLQL